MRIKYFCATAATSGLALLALVGCANIAQSTRAADVLSPPKTALPLSEAVDRLTITLLTRAEAALVNDSPPSATRALVVDPLVDRATGNQTTTTRSIERRMTSLVQSRSGPIVNAEFSSATLDRRPLVLLGTITAVAGPGIIGPTTKPTQTYRIWAAIADLRTNRIISKDMAWVQADSVDMTPTSFFEDSPAWLADRTLAAYLKTCSSVAGTVVDPAYINGLYASALVADGIRAYEAGEYKRALQAYSDAQRQPAGDQVRAYNGIYLADVRLGRTQDAEAAFGNIVSYGLQQGKLAVKMVFSPGSTRFWPDRAVSGPYDMWLRQIAAEASTQAGCLHMVGHTSKTGPAAANDTLSRARAEYVRAELIERAGALLSRTDAEGRGSAELLVGSGRDDASDVLDRRVEFEPRSCFQAGTGPVTRG